MSQTLVVLAAGLATRYGGNKQLASVGPHDEVLLDYAVYDAARAGFECVTFVIRRELELDFTTHVARRFGTKVRVNFAFQDLNDLPSQLMLPENRLKPWGTAHAILAAREVVREPFVVINADDFYGAAAYASLYTHREEMQPTDTPVFAMIGYTLRDTLSQHGGVSRGICECDERGFLERLVEVKKIERLDEGIAGITTDGDRYELHGHETVSMNTWALTPEVFPILERQFVEFLNDYGKDSDAEFLISTALNDQIVAGLSSMKVLATRDQWFGMTFQADRPRVTREIADLVERGTYPDDLTSWFQEKT